MKTSLLVPCLDEDGLDEDGLDEDGLDEDGPDAIVLSIKVSVNREVVPELL